MDKHYHIMKKDHMDKVYHDNNKLIRFAQTERLKKILKLIKHIISRREYVKVLDAGCGEGHLLSFIKAKFPKSKLFGIDISEVALKSAKQRLPRAILSKQDICQLNFQDNFFNVIICSEVLEHVSGYNKALDELKRVLKLGGFLIVSFPNEALFTILRFILLRRPAKLLEHVNSITPQKLSELVDCQLVKKVSSPFYLPFFLSPHYIMVFKK